ncbi:helicase C-terminal domain-containing protein, partial [Salmonella enterica]
RLHIIAASSMMSHGVDIDRLNIMVMLGIPLSTAEFIQATARVGRRYPSLVFVVHKIGRERDAGIYRSFSQFVSQGDRFVDPVPISKRSRQ